MTTSSLYRKINILGWITLAAYIAIVPLSYIQTPALWNPDYYPNAGTFFTSLYGQDNYNAIQSFFDGPLAVILLRWIPVLIATGATIAVMVMIRGIDRRCDTILAERIRLWSMLFAAAAFFAYPLYTQDFWLSALWGQMTISGDNPYHMKFTADMAEAFPLDHIPMTMSYGPLWAVLSGLVMAVTGGSLLATLVVFKAVLTTAWCATLLLVDRLAKEFSPRHRSLALVMTGWLPLGVLQTVAEGHNDIFLVLPVLLWLVHLIGHRMSGPVTLGVSVLSKYATAPLFLADALYVLRKQRMPFLQYCRRMLIPALMFFALMALFYRSFAFFDGVRLIGTWQFMHPDDAFKVIAGFVGDWIAPGGTVLLMIFPAIAAWQCWEYWKTPSNQMLMRLVLAIMCAVSFAVINHLWPWYLVWTLPLAALIPTWWLSRFVIGMCLLAPFSVIVWWVPEVEELKNVAALLIYAAAGLWAYLSSEHADGLVQRLPENVRMLRLRGQPVQSPAAHLPAESETVLMKRSA